MINKKSILAIFLIAIIAIPVISIYGTDDVEAADDYLLMDTGSLSFGGFDSRTPGTVSITIKNNTAADATVDVTVTYQNEKSRVLKSVSDEIPTGEEKRITLEFMIDSQGTKALTIWAESSDAKFFKGEEVSVVDHNFFITVEQSVWSNWTTYLAIVIIVLIVAIAIFLKYRNTPKAEQKITFTELEDLKRSKRGQSVSSKAPTVERKRYESGNRKK